MVFQAWLFDLVQMDSDIQHTEILLLLQ